MGGYNGERKYFHSVSNLEHNIKSQINTSAQPPQVNWLPCSLHAWVLGGGMVRRCAAALEHFEKERHKKKNVVTILSAFPPDHSKCFKLIILHFKKAREWCRAGDFKQYADDLS